MASKKISVGTKKTKSGKCKIKRAVDEVPEKNAEYVHILLCYFFIIDSIFSDMLVWLFLYSKIDVPPLPSAATDEGFVKRPVGYASYGKFKGSGGPKNLDKI